MIKYDDSYKIQQGPKFAVAEKRVRGLKVPAIHTVIHYHSDMELLFIDEGETVMQVAGRTFTANENSLILINPYEVHSGETVGSAYAHRCICFDLLQLDLPQVERFLSGELAYVNNIADTDNIKQYFVDCFDAVKRRDDGWELRAKGNLLMLFSMLTDKVSSTVPTKEQTFARSVIEYVEQHFSEGLTSKEVAEIFSYDHSYFCRKFKKIFSQSFGDYLNGYRVSKAKEMLSCSLVSKVATDCGFDSISYFSRVFKAVTGRSPSEYKRGTYELREDKQK